MPNKFLATLAIAASTAAGTPALAGPGASNQVHETGERTELTLNMPPLSKMNGNVRVFRPIEIDSTHPLHPDYNPGEADQNTPPASIKNPDVAEEVLSPAQKLLKEYWVHILSILGITFVAGGLAYADIHERRRRGNADPKFFNIGNSTEDGDDDAGIVPMGIKSGLHSELNNLIDSDSGPQIKTAHDRIQVIYPPQEEPYTVDNLELTLVGARGLIESILKSNYFGQSALDRPTTNQYFHLLGGVGDPTAGDEPSGGGEKDSIEIDRIMEGISDPVDEFEIYVNCSTFISALEILIKALSNHEYSLKRIMDWRNTVRKMEFKNHKAVGTQEQFDTAKNKALALLDGKIVEQNLRYINTVIHTSDQSTEEVVHPDADFQQPVSEPDFDKVLLESEFGKVDRYIAKNHFSSAIGSLGAAIKKSRDGESKLYVMSLMMKMIDVLLAWSETSQRVDKTTLSSKIHFYGNSIVENFTSNWPGYADIELVGFGAFMTNPKNIRIDNQARLDIMIKMGLTDFEDTIADTKARISYQNP